MLWLCKQICTASLRPPAQGRLGVGCRICLELVSRCCWRHEIRITWTFTYTHTQHRWVTQVWITEQIVVKSEDRHRRETTHWSRRCYFRGASVCSTVRIKDMWTTSYVLQLLPVVKREHKESLCIMDKDRCSGLLLADAANPCTRQPHYPSIDFSSTPTEQDTVSNKGDKSKAHCSLPFDYKNCYSLYVRQRVLKTQWCADMRVQKKHVLDYLSEILKYSCWNCCWQWKAPLTNHIFNQAPLEYSTYRKAPNLHQSVGSPLNLIAHLLTKQQLQ